jgi:pilus assembly protein CpaE
MRMVLVSSHDRQLEEMLRNVATHVASSPDLGGVAALKSTERPNVIVLDTRDQPGIPVELAAVRRAMPDAGVIVVASTLDPARMLDAMRAGVNEFLTEPVALEDVRSAVARVSALQPVAHQAKVFAFLGAKGGVGTTTLAVNVATALAESRVGRVLLVDLHPAYGDAALFFNAAPRFSVLDALENTHRLDEAYLKGLVVKTKAGLDLLCSSERAAVAAPDAQRVRALLEFVARHYTHVVLDVPRSDSAALDALDVTSRSSSSPTRSCPRCAAPHGWSARCGSATARTGSRSS